MVANLFGITEFHERQRDDLAAPQASDEQLAELSTAFAAIQSSPNHPAACESLVRSSGAITAKDRQRMLGEDEYALKQSKACCSGRPSQSDKSLKAAAGQLRERIILSSVIGGILQVDPKQPDSSENHRRLRKAAKPRDRTF